jgi:uncharacterized protein
MISVEQARAHYANGDPVHGFSHVLRVLRLVRHIGPVEGADMEVLETAALLHDIARSDEVYGVNCHAALGAERAREILADHPIDKVAAVAEAIRSHRFRDNVAPTTLEGRILYDADKLDSIGAIGVARAYAYGGQHGQELWAGVSVEYAGRRRAAGRGDATRGGHTPAHEFAFKLSRIKDTLFTETARRMAAERHRFMSAFYDRLAMEVRGEL